MAWFGSGGESVPELMAKGKYEKAIALLELDKATLDGITAKHPNVRQVLEDFYIQRASGG